MENLKQGDLIEVYNENLTGFVSATFHCSRIRPDGTRVVCYLPHGKEISDGPSHYVREDPFENITRIGHRPPIEPGRRKYWRSLHAVHLYATTDYMWRWWIRATCLMRDEFIEKEVLVGGLRLTDETIAENYPKAQRAMLAWICVARRLQAASRDVRRVVAEMLWDSRDEECWDGVESAAARSAAADSTKK